MRNRIPALLLALALALAVLPGCGGGEGESFRADLSAPVSGLDPQFWDGGESASVLSALFEGLVVRASDGSLAPGAAESWELSPDGRVYTFRLRRDALWNDADPGEGKEATPVTAGDFVFALRRLVDPEAPSPWAEDYSVIRGAAEVLSGVRPAEALAVRALDDYTLEITLEEPNSGFLELLAQPPAFPCNEAFFESTRARYGQSIAYTLGNGPFEVAAWEEGSITLRASGGYVGERVPLCQTAVFYSGREGGAWQLFLEGKSDFCLAAGMTAEEVEAAGFAPRHAGETVWALVFRQEEGSVLENENVRRALALAVDREGFGDRVPQGFSPAASLVPDGAELGGEDYRELAGPAPAQDYDPEGAREALAAGLGELELASLPKLTLLVTEEMGSLGGYLQRVWQEELLQYINLEMLPQEELEARTAGEGWQMAVMPLESGDGALSALELFSAASPGSPALVRDEVFEGHLAGARTAAAPAAAAGSCLLAESRLRDTAAALPLFSREEYYALSPGWESLSYRSGQLLLAATPPT